MFYEFSGFDREHNRELWRERSWWSLHCEWLRDLATRDQAACKGYKAWLYVRVRQGELLPADMLGFRDKAVADA